MHTADPGIPIALRDWIEQTIGQLIAVKSRAGGGVSREGCEVTFRLSDDSEASGYLSFDRSVDNSDARLNQFQRETSAISALQGSGVKVPDLLGYTADHYALITALTPGEHLYSNLKTDDDRRDVAIDYMDQLARLHQLEPSTLDLRGFAEEQAVGTLVRAELSRLRTIHLQGIQDPLVVFCLKWLEENVPEYPGSPRLIHGDAGPSNFLFQDGQVTAMLDWELTHLGDPMEDFAWICFREMVQPFYSLPRCFGAYERSGGEPIDLARLHYYRVFIQIKIIVKRYYDLKVSEGPLTSVLGDVLMFYTMHRRTIIEGLADAMGVDLPELAVPYARASPDDRYYDIALTDLKEFVVPHVEEEAGRHRTKGLARVIKYWRAERQHQADFERQELAELKGLLGTPCDSIHAGRADVSRAIESGEIKDREYLRYLYARELRETELMRSSMGRLADCNYSALTD